ncbi:MAG: phosphoenolpyruvate synthase [Bacteroidetes bacterium GWF2_43_63]|nr:MAG: phosphoenolpyruvate synthase [Bacteroidetes bacterium GWE2_42_42]OFY55845.1 MAG: phosphoenolpyruvate synthase [Bacteroidetes bacterium GWF2_43_63]HBG71234.1 phosphoenolpyruvate synthase [Bacteroidales bacterium]HCB60545.1 phosphoenolpyruvate synthase [Bacteroidales bacterium]HCY22498.1 phosphoenolpyruvate synthase [Bacteroidales bacterium]
MSKQQNKPDLNQAQFHDTLFDHLMEKRIEHILLICSTYDAFILEEDGRINEAIFQEYVSLNLRYPPRFIKAHSAEKAMEILENDRVDLVINMLSISDQNPFEFSKVIKHRFANIPVVVLTPFSREVSQRLAVQDMSGVDYVFSWLGNTNLLLAIIKLIEDKMNTDHDVGEVGVQCILLVEDSVRYYSSYLPNMYRIVIEQSRAFMAEGLNDHQRTLRLRGRPKILLATNFEQALSMYEKYKSNMLGMISDISFNRNNVKDKNAGFELCKIVQADDPYFPILLQSSDAITSELAEGIKVKFVHKFSKTLLHELTDFLLDYLAFGDFRIINPADGAELSRAKDLQALQDQIFSIPDESLKYHIDRNHFSKWLRARALFSLGKLFRQANSKDFASLDEVREYLFKGMAKYRSVRGRGVIATFDRNKFNEYILFSRVGEGSIGGKARGLAFIDNILKRNKLAHRFDSVELTIPRTVVLSTDVFSEFMVRNDLYDFAISSNDDEEILSRFLEAELNYETILDLKSILRVIKSPMAVRSSSLLEDSHYQPFAGIYSTYMIPNTGDDRDRLKMLMQCIKAVYASVYYKESKAYMTSTSNLIDEEKMAIILQEVCGFTEGDYFFPVLSGVARSVNFYPISPEKAEDGVVSIAYGLGKYIVDGGMSLRFSPRFPEKAIQLSSIEMMLKDTQKEFFAINLKRNLFTPKVDDNAHIERFSVSEGDQFTTFRMAASTYVYHDDRVVDGISQKGMRIITFNNFLKHNVFPLAEMMTDILETSSHEMGKPVEIEFAINMDGHGHHKVFNLLQIRPIVNNKENLTINLEQINREKCIVVSESALGNGIYDSICDVVYIVPEKFNAAETWQLAQVIEQLNKSLTEEKRNYLLIGPGRWGSSDPWLGIPVKWSQISAARVIVEAGLNNFHIEPSQGTHFFQNLTSFRVAYFTVNDFIKQGLYNTDFLNAQEALFDNGVVRHVRFDRPMEILVDGKKHFGIVAMPGLKAISAELKA